MLGASFGYSKEIIIIYRRYKKTKISPGNNAEVNKFPTDTFKTLPSKTRTTDGGIIWPRVPDDAITPVAKVGLYPLFNMVGKLIRPIVTTVAPVSYTHLTLPTIYSV